MTRPPKPTTTAVRIATALILIPMVVAAAWWGSTGLIAGFAGLVTLLALLEFFSLGEHVGLHGYRIWTSICALAIIFQQWAATQQSQSAEPGRQRTADACQREPNCRSSWCCSCLCWAPRRSRSWHARRSHRRSATSASARPGCFSLRFRSARWCGCMAYPCWDLDCCYSRWCWSGREICSLISWGAGSVKRAWRRR